MHGTAELEPLSNARLGELRSLLAEHLPWSRHDFIRNPRFVIPGDREILATDLTREMGAENDLRFNGWIEGDPVVILAERLNWDSDFFGYGVAHLRLLLPVSKPFFRPYIDYTDMIRKFLGKARDKGIKYLFATIFPEDIAALQSLTGLGFSLLETRLFYHRSMVDYDFPKRFGMRPAATGDIPRLADAAAETKNLYDRFHSDPFIQPQDRDRLMRKWVEASIMEGFADITVVPDHADPSAFITVRYHRDKWEKWGYKMAQPVFGAVSPQERGWYVKLISEISYHLKDIGVECAFFATQNTNRAVLHSWEKLGYKYGRSEHILRIVLD